MEKERPEIGWEMEKSLETTPPAIESFFDPKEAVKTWPEHITSNPEFIEQAESRASLVNSLEEVSSALPRPDMSLQDAVKNGFVSEDQVTNLYNSLSHELGRSPDYDRMALYLPFEYLPTTEDMGSEKLQESANNFRQVFLESWQNLLSTQDVRANFVDGDVIELHQREGDLPRVVKAAHLIPILVERGFIQVDQVINLLETTDDSILISSVADTIPALKDLGLISDSHYAQLRNLNNETINKCLDGVDKSSDINTVSAESQNFDIGEIKSVLAKKLETITSEVNNQAITEKRKAWLIQEEGNRLIESISDPFAEGILNGIVTPDISEQYVTADTDPAVQKVFVDALRKALEKLSTKDQQGAEELYHQFESSILSLWNSKDNDVHGSVEKLFQRLNRLNIVSDQQFSGLGLRQPALDGSSMENLKNIESEIKEIQSSISKIETDPLLSSTLYPVVLIYGSQIKGYGDKNSDIDVAVMVKPNTDISMREEIQGSLQNVFNHEKIRGGIVQFWLEETEQGLMIKDFEHADPFIGGSYWTYLLFGSAWEGNSTVVKDLRTKVLSPYLYETDKELYGHKARHLYLEEMERNFLQYRLMHSGYEKYYPSYGGLKTPHADRMDSRSMFWDSGYRQAATKLYAKQVFLPNLHFDK